MKNDVIPEFTVYNDYENNVYPRYRVIVSRIPWDFVIPLGMLMCAWLIFIFITNPNFFVDISRQADDSVERIGRLLMPFMALVCFPFLAYRFFCFKSEKFFERQKLKRDSDAAIKMKNFLIDKRPESFYSILNRTYYRYCASLEMVGNDMVFEDRVRGLVNGKLDGVDKKKGESEVFIFDLRLEQITAVWIARDYIVIRFCWGTSFTAAWDFIIDRSKFTKGTDEAFIECLKSRLKYQRITYDLVKWSKHNYALTFGNESTNLGGKGYTQRKVKILYNHWGPFKKRERKSKEKETEK